MSMVHNTKQTEDRRARKREMRAERIVEAALRLVVEEGLEAMTLQRLARDLDYAVGALYRYFASKDALLAELQRRAIETLGTELRQDLQRARGALAATNTAGRAADLALVLVPARLWWTLPERAPAQFRLLSLMVGDPRDLLQDAAATLNLASAAALMAEVSALLQAAAASGALEAGDAPLRVVFLWASLQGLLQLRKLGRFEPGLFRSPELFAELLRGLLRGWGARPEDVQAALGLLGTFEPEIPSNL